MMGGADVERLVSVAAGDKRGSGYLVARNLVLTAGHCVRPPGTGVEVRRFSQTEPGRYDLTEPVAFQVAVKGQGELDFALLNCAETDDPFEFGEAGFGDVRLGQLVGEGEVPAQALGFPRSQVDARKNMNVEDARGCVLPLTGSRASRADDSTERLNFQVNTGTSATSGAASLWSGMSGAALFSGDRLLGVIVEDRATIEGRLWAVPVKRIFTKDGANGASECLRRATGGDEEASFDPVWAGGGVLRPPYSPLPPPSQWSEADLLEPRYNVVPFHGRDKELDELEQWCKGSDPIRVRLLSGAGAVGKTRLARELCLRMMNTNGWVTGLLDPLRVDFSALRGLRNKRLLVIDDADAHAGQLEALLAQTAEDPEPHGTIRILAVAHGPGSWWQGIKRRYETLVDENDPQPLDSPGNSERKAVYTAATTAFTRWYEEKDAWKRRAGERDLDTAAEGTAGTGPHGAAAPLDLDSGDFDSYLLILIQALVDARASLDKKATVATAPASRSRADALLDYAIDVERQRWQEAAKAAGLPADPVLLERVVAISGVAVAAGETEGIGETEASRRLRLVPDLADEPEWRRRAFARWQHAQSTGEDYLRPLQPARLAERLGARVLSTFPDLACQLLDVEGTGPGTPANRVDQSRQVLKVLQLLQLTAENAGPSQDHRTAGDIAGVTSAAQKDARAALERALRQHASPLLRLVKEVAMSEHDESARAIGASLAAALNTTLRKRSAQAVAAEVLAELDDSCPDVLLELATAIAEHAVAYYQRSDAPHTRENRAGLATALQRLSLYLANSGQRSRACEIAWEAVDTYRALEQTDPSPENRLQLAEALSDLGDRLDDVGRFDEAHDHAREAVRMFEELYRANPALVHPFRLAAALCTQATAANDIGRPREALQAATEACELTRKPPEKVEGEGDELKGRQAFVLRGLSWQLGRNGRVDDALARTKEACARYEELFKRNPGRWQRDYAQTLSIYGAHHEAKRQWDECIEKHTEAVDTHYRALELRYREAVRPQHGIALRRLASGYLGRARHALALEKSHIESQSPADPTSDRAPREKVLSDLEEARKRGELALDQYQNMQLEDRWANRLSEASVQCLRSEILTALGEIHKSAQPSLARKYFSDAETAVSEAIAKYEDMDHHTWQNRFDLAHAKTVLAQTEHNLDKPVSHVRAAYEDARRFLTRINAEAPGSADDSLEWIDGQLKLLPKADGHPREHGKRRRTGVRAGAKKGRSKGRSRQK